MDRSARQSEWAKLKKYLPSADTIEIEATAIPQFRRQESARVYPSVIASRGQRAPRFVIAGYSRDDLPPTKAHASQARHIGWMYKRGGGTSIFGSKGWKRRRFFLLGSILRYFKTQEALDDYTSKQKSVAKLGGSLEQGEGGGELLRAELPPATAADGPAPGSPGAILSRKLPVVKSIAAAGRSAPSLRRRRAESSPLRSAKPAGAPSGGQPMDDLRLPAGVSTAPGGTAPTADLSPAMPPAAPTVPSTAPAAAGGGGAAPGAGSEERAAAGTAVAKKHSGLGAIVVYGGWMRRLRGYEKAARAHVLLLLPPLGHRVYYVSAESELELLGWEEALRKGGMRDVPPDEDLEVPGDRAAAGGGGGHD